MSKKKYITSGSFDSLYDCFNAHGSSQVVWKLRFGYWTGQCSYVYESELHKTTAIVSSDRVRITDWVIKNNRLRVIGRYQSINSSLRQEIYESALLGIEHGEE